MSECPGAGKRFILIDHSIQGGGGHYLAYAERVLGAAEQQGLQPVLATNRRFEPAKESLWPFFPIYRNAIWFQPADRPARGVAKLARPLRRWKHAEIRRRKLRDFFEDTTHLLQKIEPVEGDLVFIPTLGEPELGGLARLFDCSVRSRIPSWHLLMRRSIYGGCEPGYVDQVAEVAALRSTFVEVERVVGERPRVFYYTDTNALSRQYEHLLAGHVAKRFFRVPIPVAADFAGETADQATPLRLVYVGDARGEKGFQHLPRIVEEAADLPVRFSIQCYLPEVGDEPEIRAARDELSRLAGAARVELIPETLSEPHYRDLVRSADILLVPYDADLYYARSSGIFAEAMVAGRPVIVPSATWMSRHVAAADWRFHRDLLTPDNVLASHEWGAIDSSLASSGSTLIVTQGSPAFLTVESAADATHVMLAFEQSTEGDLVRITLTQNGASGESRTSNRTSGGRHGTSSLLFALDANTAILRLTASTALQTKRARLESSSCVVRTTPRSDRPGARSTVHVRSPSVFMKSSHRGRW